MGYNEHQIREWIRCKDDVAYFAENYIRFTTANGVVNATLNDFQQSVVDNFNNSRVLFMPGKRMEGKTTIAAIILLHRALFDEYDTSAIFARTKYMSNYVLEVITEMYDRLPEFLTSSRMVTRNKGKIEFDNGCSIISVGSSIDACKGRTLTTVYIDESEWFDKLQELITWLYPTIASSPYAKIFALSSTMTEDAFRAIRAV